VRAFRWAGRIRSFLQSVGLQITGLTCSPFYSYKVVPNHYTFSKLRPVQISFTKRVKQGMKNSTQAQHESNDPSNSVHLFVSCAALEKKQNQPEVADGLTRRFAYVGVFDSIQTAVQQIADMRGVVMAFIVPSHSLASQIPAKHKVHENQ
jgi:hypothetical protein